MTLIKLRYIDRFVDRHGRERFYFRRDRGPRIALPGRPGTPEFMAAYERATMGEAVERGPKQRGAPGTFDRLVQDYFTSSEFLRLAASSQKSYGDVILDVPNNRSYIASQMNGECSHVDPFRSALSQRRSGLRLG